MAEVKPGEVVTQVLEQQDDAGLVISRVTVELFGYERDEANMGTQGFAQATLDQVKVFDEYRKGAGKGSPKTPGR